MDEKFSARFKAILKGESGGVLRSDQDTDHQLLLFVPFMEGVKIKAISFTVNANAIKEAGNEGKLSGPAKVKVFVGGQNLDFDGASSTPASQAFALTAKQLEG